jgi:membrane-associated phospholipid phosphatase
VDRRRLLLLLAALGCAFGLVVVGVYGLAWNAGHARDVAMLHGFAALEQTRYHSLLRFIAQVPNPLPYAMFGVACIAVALWRDRTPRAVAVLVLFFGTGLTTHILKHVLATPRFAAWLGHEQIENVSWPSGHSTAAMTMALCAVLVAPPAVRAVTALLGGAFAMAVGYSTLALAWHYPSDVVAGFLVAGLWVALAVAVLQRVESEDAEPVRAVPWEPLVVVGGLGALVAAALVGAEAETVAFYAQERTTVVAGALVIAVLALVLAATVSAATGPGGRRARSAPSP